MKQQKIMMTSCCNPLHLIHERGKRQKHEKLQWIHERGEQKHEKSKSL